MNSFAIVIRKKVNRLISNKLGELVNESLMSKLGYISSYFLKYQKHLHIVMLHLKKIDHKIQSSAAKHMFYKKAVNCKQIY
jgi:hypothetical protein